jgi:PBP1b-binding outer membrane lipoprotein LpoB
MKQLTALLLLFAFIFGGCSGKEMKDGTNDIASDIGDFGEKVFKVRE